MLPVGLETTISAGERS